MLLKERFKELQQKEEKALVGFLTAGDPTPEICAETAIAMADSGIDILELGIPFSDPTADGPVIQRASKRALDNGTDIIQVFSIIEQIRKRSNIPIVLFTYYNPLFTFGEERFSNMALQAGANGVLVVDLPFGEESLLTDFDTKNFPKIELVAPTTSEERLQKITATASGFIYLVSMIGVTGSNGIQTKEVEKNYRRIREYTTTPVCTGFGIHTEEDVKKTAQFCDGVVIGSAFVAAIEDNLQHKDLPARIAHIAQRYKQATRA